METYVVSKNYKFLKCSLLSKKCVMNNREKIITYLFLQLFTSISAISNILVFENTSRFVMK